ncbi:MAG: FAD-dependent oxidoreductase [Bacteroidetes bacterium]|nr:MAG: FAD-dependent oxidoreductase [Bacteroidota bacterium]
MKKKVIVIGAGIAGIASAIELVQKGIEVIVLERRAFPGGRMYSILDNETGEKIDNGQHLMAGAYVNFFNILKTLNTFNLIEFQKSLIVPFLDLNGTSSILDSSLFPGKAGILYGFLKLKGVGFKSKINTIKLFRNLINGYADSDGLTVQQLLNRYQIQEDITEMFWQPLCLAVMNLNVSDASAPLFANVLKRLFLKKDYSSLAFSKVPLMDLISPFDEWLQNNYGKILYKSTVKELQIDEHKITVIPDDNNIISADAVISAIPWHSLLKILPVKYHDYLFFNTLNEYQPSSIISMYLWLDKNITEMKFTGMIGAKTQWIFNRRNICSENSINEKYPGHITLTISGANNIINTNPEKLVKECFEEVKKAFKSDVKLLRWKMIKEKRATFIANPETDDKRLSQYTPIENLFLAGDWTATGLPATLEGAAFSGVLAADFALNYLNEK